MSDSYYGQPILKRPVWKWYVPAYFFTGGVAAGTSMIAVAARLAGDRPLARRCLVASTGAVVASTGLLVADLGKPRKFLNMLRVAKVTSPMSVGSWVLSAFGTASAVATGCELLDVAPGVGKAAEVAAAALAPVLATYTGVLVADTAVPAWHGASAELPALFASGAAASAGALGLLLAGESAATARLAAGGALAEVVAALVMEKRLGDAGKPYHEGLPRLLSRASGGCLLAGAVAIAAGRRRSGAVLVLAGAAAERFAVYEAGLASADDPEATVAPQRRRLNAGGPARLES